MTAATPREGVQLFRIRSPRTAGRKPGGRRSSKVALLTALAAVGVAGPANADLAAVGPVDPATQVPAWFQDTNGLKLGLCLTAPFCLSTAADFADPDGEAFYFNAGADLTINGTGKARLVLAQEAVSAPSGPAAFMRVRVAVTAAAANARYTVTHPFGRVTITTDGRGNGRSTVDSGCALAPCPTFGGALSGEIGPFLTWTPDAALPPNHIGDGLTPHTVTGGTNGNSFTVAGPGGSTTDLFTVAGVLAGPPVPVLNRTPSLDFGSQPLATATAPQTATIRSFGVPDAAGASNLAITGAGISGPGAADYRIVSSTCPPSMPSGASCGIGLQFVPTAAGPRPASLDVTSNAAPGVHHVALNGTGVDLRAAALAARNAMRISKLRTTHRMTRARVLRQGLRLSMHLPQDAEILKISILRVRNGKANRKPVWLGYRVVGRLGPAGLYRLRLDSRTLRRRLKAGLYQLNVTPGVSKKQLGVTATTRIRITSG
jgi:hypothetical protein